MQNSLHGNYVSTKDTNNELSTGEHISDAFKENATELCLEQP